MKRKSFFFLFMLLASSLVTAQQKVKVDLSSPNATIFTHQYFLEKNSYSPSKSAKTIQGYKGKKAVEIAVRLKKIYDGRGLKIDYNKVPSDESYLDSTNIRFGNRYVLFPEKMPEIYVEKVGDKWYYSKESADKVEKIYSEVYPWYAKKLTDLLLFVGNGEFLGIKHTSYVLVVILLITSILIFFLLKLPIFFILKKIQFLLFRRTNETIEKALKATARPIAFLIIFWFLETMTPALMLDIHLNSFFYLVINIMTTVFLVFIFLKFSTVVVNFYAGVAANSKNKLANQLIPVIHNSMTIIAIIIGILKLLSLFGVDPITVLAGASIGGLALALASQDTFKNVIGTLMIFLDQPFKIGDYIENDQVEGWVENVGFRSTRIRAMDTSVFQVPNSSFSEMMINNKGMLIYRRYHTTLSVRYDTPPELIQAFTDGIKAIIYNSPDTRKDLYTVDFTEYGASSLQIVMNVYFLKIYWVEGLSCRHRLNMAILKLAAELGVSFAFPSSTIMIEQFPEKQEEKLNYNTDRERIEKILENLKNKGK